MKAGLQASKSANQAVEAGKQASREGNPLTLHLLRGHGWWVGVRHAVMQQVQDV